MLNCLLDLNVLIFDGWIKCAEETFFSLVGVALFYENHFSAYDVPSVKTQFCDAYLSVLSK